MHDPDANELKAIQSDEVAAKLEAGWHGPFRVGELLPWKGVWFVVETIYSDGIMLKVKPREG